MREKDIVDRHERDLHGDDVAETSGAQVEEEAVAVAHLDHHAPARLLTPRREGAAAHEEDAHLIGAELFGAWEVVAGVDDTRRRLEVGR